MPNYSNREKDVIDALASELAEGSVRMTNLQPIVAAMRTGFPVHTNRILWETIPETRSYVAASSSPSVGKRITEEHFDEFLIDANVGDTDELFAFGDVFREVAFILTASLLRRRLSAFIDEPMGVLIATPDAGWCFNYTFNAFIYYGPAVKRNWAGPHEGSVAGKG